MSTDCFKPAFVHIYLEGQRYAARQWHIIPRVGDEIMMKDNQNNFERAAFVVSRVVFLEENEDDIRRQLINIEVKRL